MLIVCPNCATSYQVDPSSLSGAGRSVRCLRCRKVWFASNPGALTDIAHAHREDVNIYTASNSVAGLAEPPVPTLQTPQQPPIAALPPEMPVVAELPGEAAGWDDRGPAPRPDLHAEPPPSPTAAIEPAPAHAPGESNSVPPLSVAPPLPENVEAVAARRIRRRPPARRKSGWPVPGLSTTILLLLAINAGLIAFRADIARLLPQTASLYAAIGLPVNLRGLVFTEIATRKDAQDGVQMLVVEGVIKSNSRRASEVPRIRFSVRNTRGQEIYTWTALPSRNVLAPGATLAFRSRLASPPPESHEVLVRFFNRRDLVAGIQ
jgi:predicted Zn finger-like uncharacterized protein